MSILILATAINFNIISNIYKNLCDDISCIHITDTQQLVNEMTTDDASLAIVAIDGAAGMETISESNLIFGTKRLNVGNRG